MAELIQKVAVASCDVTHADNFKDLVIAQWIKECDISALTAKSYNVAAHTLFQFLQDKPLDETALIDFREYLKKSKATSTARLYFVIVKKFVAWLAKRGYCAANFAEGIKGVKLDSSTHSRDALTVNEAIDVIGAFDCNNLKSLRDKCIMALMICCGLRTIEVVRLDCGDIEKRRGVWTMRIHGKARAGKVDTVIMPPQVKSMIDEYLKMRGKVNSGAPLFVSTSRRNKNSRLQTQSISRLAKRAFINVGIDSQRVTAHSCRHSCATIALEAGVDLRAVSNNLRHKSITTTEIYLHNEQLFSNSTANTVADIIFNRSEAYGTKN